MAIFNSKLLNYQRVMQKVQTERSLGHRAMRSYFTVRTGLPGSPLKLPPGLSGLVNLLEPQLGVVGTIGRGRKNVSDWTSEAELFQTDSKLGDWAEGGWIVPPHKTQTSPIARNPPQNTIHTEPSRKKQDL